MNDLMNCYIGRECLIYTMDSQITGIVKEINENWAKIENNSNTQLINLEFVTRIREYPTNKNGKKKSIITD